MDFLRGHAATKVQKKITINSMKRVKFGNCQEKMTSKGYSISSLKNFLGYHAKANAAY